MGDEQDVTGQVGQVGQVIDEVRSLFGPRFVPGRVEAETEARRLLDERVGAMERADIELLGRLFNRHERAGRIRYDRFSPGFAGAIMHKLGRDTGRFNRIVSELWHSPIDDAVELLGRMYADRSILPGAGSSLPSFLLYLRDPDRFGVCINATMKGLGVAVGGTFRADSRTSYERFCASLVAWRQQYDVAPPEADAILTHLMRHTIPPVDAQPRDGTDDGVDVVVDEINDGELASLARLTAEQVAARCHLPVEQIDAWVAALTSTKRQAFFFGPPGTGKTYLALLLARHLATSPAHIVRTQFHPAYSYEDFVEGLRPVTASDQGGLRYQVRDGLFFDLCGRARKAPNETFVLVIDEMNRADLAAVFGELLFLLEYRDTVEVTLPYSQRQLSVPGNLLLLGTANTADRSLALLDFALRRRFNAFPLLPSEDVLTSWAATQPGVNAELALGVFRLIRDRVGLDAPVSPGHSYWMVDQLDAATAERIWSYQVRPYLAEYWFEQPAELQQLDEDVRALIAERT